MTTTHAHPFDEDSGLHRRPPTLEDRVRRLELSVTEVKWLVRAGAAVGLYNWLGPHAQKLLQLIGGVPW
jgi:hypothetical protein